MSDQIQELVEKVSRELLVKMAAAFTAETAALDSALKQTVGEVVLHSPTALRIVSDPKVIRQLGLVDPRAAVRSIAEAVQKASKVTVTTSPDVVTVTLEAIRSDFLDALNASGASFDSVNRLAKKTTIRWLEWVLFGKYEMLSSTYGVFTKKTPIAASRTRDTIMLKLRGKFKGGFILSPGVEGSADDNFLTRAATTALPKMIAILEAAFRRLQNRL